MNHTRIVIGLALALLLLLAACGQPAGSSTGNQAQADQQFIADRSGTSQPGGEPRQEQPVMGTVEEIDGAKVVVKGLDGTSVTVQLGDDTRVQRIVKGTATDIKIGESLMAFGSQQGDVFQAGGIQIGGSLGGGANMVIGGPGSAPPSGGEGGQMVIQKPRAGAGNMPPQALSTVTGTVDQVDGTTITVKGHDGTRTTLQLADGAEIDITVDAQRADIQIGKTISADVTRAGAVIQAKTVTILPDLPKT